MILNCGMCNRPICIDKEEYQSILVVENRLTFPKQNHHSFILCNSCYHSLRKLYKTTEKGVKKRNDGNEEVSPIYFE